MRGSSRRGGGRVIRQICHLAAANIAKLIPEKAPNCARAPRKEPLLPHNYLNLQQSAVRRLAPPPPPPTTTVRLALIVQPLSSSRMTGELLASAINTHKRIQRRASVPAEPRWNLQLDCHVRLLHQGDNEFRSILSGALLSANTHARFLPGSTPPSEVLLGLLFSLALVLSIFLCCRRQTSRADWRTHRLKLDILVLCLMSGEAPVTDLFT